MELQYNAVILAGGAGSRLGGTDKAAVELGGEPLINHAFTATADAQNSVVVGTTSVPLPEGTLLAHEEPRGGGPAAAFGAGLSALAAAGVQQDWTLLLACDLPGAEEAVRRLDRALCHALRSGYTPDGVVLTDPDGHSTWVCGMYRTQSVQHAAATLGDLTNRGLKSLLGELDLIQASPRGNEWRDVDTWDDHADWVKLLAKPSGGVVPEKTVEREQWDAWITEASESLGIDPSLVDVTLIHELSKNVAHNVIRPLAPVSTYMLGIVVGQRLAAGEPVDTATRRALAALIPQGEDAPEK